MSSTNAWAPIAMDCRIDEMRQQRLAHAHVTYDAASVNASSTSVAHTMPIAETRNVRRNTPRAKAASKTITKYAVPAMSDRVIVHPSGSLRNIRLCCGKQDMLGGLCYHSSMSLTRTFSEAARKLGTVSALGIALLCPVYAITLIGGLLSLSTRQQPIGDPYFSVMEILIMLLTPLMVVLASAIHAWAPEKTKVFGLLSLVFMSLLAVLTCSVHFVILTVSRDPEVAALTWAPLLLSFKWPSIAYALDILGWDVFFALSALFAACVFEGSRLAIWIRGLLGVSGALAFAGLSGVVSGDIQLRNIGVIGYVGVFPIAAFLLAILFFQAKPCPSD